MDSSGADQPVAAAGARRRGRPRQTSARDLEVAALRLFAEQGFDDTTVDDIAAAAGVSRRTFFRYFDSKVAVLWQDFDNEVVSLRAALDDTPPDVPVMDAVRHAVVGVNRYRADDLPELRRRMHLVASVPAIHASSAVHYDAWERAITEFVARRVGQPADALQALAVGMATLAACRAAYDVWLRQDDDDLTDFLDEALKALAAGFDLERISSGSLRRLPTAARYGAP